MNRCPASAQPWSTPGWPRGRPWKNPRAMGASDEELRQLEEQMALLGYL